jgi:hypothetical protein
MAVEHPCFLASAASAASERDAIGTALFVGGPWDGVLEPMFDHAPATRLALNVPGCGVRQGQWSQPPNWLTPDMAMVPVVEYRRETFHTPVKDFYFWVAADITPEDLMARLMVAYHQHKECD